MKIEESNKLIGKFMDIQVRTRVVGGISYRPDKYWECLMPVVEKINSLGYHTMINGVDFHNHQWTAIYNKDRVTIANIHGYSLKDNTYKAVIKFIKWYNKNG